MPAATSTVNSSSHSIFRMGARRAVVMPVSRAMVAVSAPTLCRSMTSTTA